jgi:hypothetical protein
MNEDDTFNRLKKSSFEHLESEFQRLKYQYKGDPKSYNIWTSERNRIAHKWLDSKRMATRKL